MSINPVLNEVIVLANDEDWKAKEGEFELNFEKFDFKIKRITASEFEKYKTKSLIMILGGPDTSQGVGDYVKQVLTKEEQNEMRNGEKTVFLKTDVWSKPQVVIILSSNTRASEALEYLRSLGPFYQELEQAGTSPTETTSPTSYPTSSSVTTTKSPTETTSSASHSTSSSVITTKSPVETTSSTSRPTSSGITTTKSPIKTTSSTSHSTSSSVTTPSSSNQGGICGPGAIMGLVLIPLLINRKR